MLITVNPYSEGNGGTSKGYINSLKPLAPECDAANIESCLPSKDRRSETATYKNLDDNWYRFFFASELERRNQDSTGKSLVGFPLKRVL